jgi:hypothetical protein
MRIENKLHRYMSITNKGIRDNLIDLHNYSAMALMLLDEILEIRKGVNKFPIFYEYFYKICRNSELKNRAKMCKGVSTLFSKKFFISHF